MAFQKKVWIKRGAFALAAAIVGLVGGPWVYINVIRSDAPEALTLEPSATSVSAPASSVLVNDNLVDGEWQIATDSVVGYRVKEILFGQSTEGVARTENVTGSLTISNNSVSAAKFQVDMSSLVSDSDRRDRQVNSRILDTVSFPTATFNLKSPIVLSPEAIAGSDFSVSTVGVLTLRGVTKDVNVDLVARLVDDLIEVNGKINIKFSDWSIPDPSVSGITVDPTGLLEFLLRFTR